MRKEPNDTTDLQHAHHVVTLAMELFDLQSRLQYKTDSKAVQVVISSIGLVNWLKTKGMPGGNKMSKLHIPDWILKNKLYQKRFIRGLFDTDGCIFKDKHVINGKTYLSRGWTITSFSARLRNEIVTVMQGLGFHPTLRDSQVSVHMRRRPDIERYFKEIGTSNNKHLRRYLTK